MTQNVRVERLIQQGYDQLERGQYQAAIVSFDKAIELKADDHKAWYSRGIALENLGRFEEAIASCDKALALNSDCYQALYCRGNALRELERYEEALASYDQALKIKPNYPPAWTNRGSVLGALQRHEEAISSYDQALTINLNFSEAWKAWCGRGQAAGHSARCEPLFASLSSIAMRNPAVNKRGYEGALASYQEGLKHIHQDTHPEGWGCLQWIIGKSHYFQGSIDSRPFSYWYKAVKSYNEALKTLTQEAFPELHLEILQDLVKAKLGLGQEAEAEELQRRGSDLLRRLLNDPNRSDSSKKQLALKFVGFNQLTVDLAVQSGQMVKALEVAEEGKNACLTWLLYAWSDEIPKPNWEEIKQLVKPKAAVVYWHLSPAALTTFILKHNAPEPIVIEVDIPNYPDKRGIEEGKSSIFSSQEGLEGSKLSFLPFQGWLGGILNKQEIPQSLRRLQ